MANINGTDNPDTLNGTNHDDVIKGRGGEDTIYGELGKDKIYGGEGKDTINGGLDADILHGEKGNDRIYGGGGDDDGNKIYGGQGIDVIFGGGGDDKIYGESSEKDYHSGAGEYDYLNGYRGNDFIDAGAGNDLPVGGEGSDTVYGGLGKDGINGWVDTSAPTYTPHKEIDTLVGGYIDEYGNLVYDGVQDTFFLGNSSAKDPVVYYNDGDPNTLGQSDYGLIKDWEVGIDKILLAGSSNNYYIGDAVAFGVTTTPGTAILYLDPNIANSNFEVIGVLENINLSQVNLLDPTQFQYLT